MQKGDEPTIFRYLIIVYFDQPTVLQMPFWCFYIFSHHKQEKIRKSTKNKVNYMKNTQKVVNYYLGPTY